MVFKGLGTVILSPLIGTFARFEIIHFNKSNVKFDIYFMLKKRVHKRCQPQLQDLHSYNDCYDIYHICRVEHWVYTCCAL